MRFLRGVGAVLFAFILFWTLFFTSVETVVYNMAFYRWHYETHHIDADTQMSVEALMNVTVKMVAYLKGERENLDMQEDIDGVEQEVFGEREKLHMIDVRGLSVPVHIMKWTGWILMLGALIFGFFHRKWLSTALGAVKYVYILLGIGILTIAGLLVSDFEKYFTIFHLIFFDNDLWLLDPATDILILMVPEIFFYTVAVSVVVIFMLLIAATLTAAEISKKKLNR